MEERRECGGVEIADAGDDDIIRHVLRLVEGPHVLDGEGLQERLIPEDGMTVGMDQQVLIPEEIPDPAVGVVAVHMDLREDDLALLAEFLLGKGRMLQDVRQHPERLPQIARFDEQIHAGEIMGGEGVDGPAVAPDFLLDGAGRPRGGALEQHVLQEVGDAGAQVLPFAAQPAEDADFNRDQGLPAVLFPDHHQTVLERGAVQVRRGGGHGVCHPCLMRDQEAQQDRQTGTLTTRGDT